MIVEPTSTSGLYRVTRRFGFLWLKVEVRLVKWDKGWFWYPSMERVESVDLRILLSEAMWQSVRRG